MFDFWTDTLKSAYYWSVYAYSKDFGSYVNDFVRLGEVMVDFKTNMENTGHSPVQHIHVQ